MRSRLIPLLALSSALTVTASMSRNERRGPLRRGPVRNTDPATGGGPDTGTTQTTPATLPATGAPPATGAQGDAGATTFTQADLDRALARERAALAKKHADELAALRARVPADDPHPPADAAAREAAAKREREKAAKDLEEARTLAATERTRRHTTMLEAGATRATAGIEFVGRDAAEVVATSLRGMLRVDDLGDGKEGVTLVDGKTEIDLNDSERVTAYVRKRFPSLIKAASGAGAPHGNGGGNGGGGAPDFSKMTPAELIAYDLKSKR